MTDDIFSRDRSIHAAIISYPNQRVTWAGEGIAENTLFFGTHHGVLLQSGIDHPLEGVRPIRIVQERESINGVAWFAMDGEIHLGASTRAEIAVARFLDPGREPSTFRWEVGALGIISGISNRFFCPAGPNGLISTFPKGPSDYGDHYLPANPDVPYFKDVTSLGFAKDPRGELVVAACRSGGLLYAVALSSGVLFPLKVSKLTSRPFDIVGVADISSQESPRALMAMGRDCSLHFIRDYERQETDSLHLPQVPGNVYKLLRYQDHVVFLTSKGIGSIRNLVKQFYDRHELGGFRTVTFLKLEAIDINIAFDRWLLIVTIDGIVRMDLAELFPVTEIVIPESIRQRMNPDFPVSWERDVEEISAPVWQKFSLPAGVMELTA